MTHKMNLIEIIIIAVSVLVIIMAILFFNISTQQLAYAAGNKGASENATANKADLLQQRGVPGKGIEKAPGLQKPFNPNFQNGANKPASDNSTSVSPGSDNSTPNKAWILQQKGVPGKGINEAPGLQKAVNQKAWEKGGFKRLLLKWQERFREMFRKQKRGNTSPEDSD